MDLRVVCQVRLRLHANLRDQPPPTNSLLFAINIKRKTKFVNKTNLFPSARFEVRFEIESMNDARVDDIIEWIMSFRIVFHVN